MPEQTSTQPGRYLLVYQQWSRDVQLGMQNLLVHGMRSLLTMLGMIFGVAAVVAMLSIGAGARQKVMALIEQMGVHNLIVEAKETVEWQAHQKIRKVSQGLSLQDYRVIQDDLEDVVASTKLTSQCRYSTGSGSSVMKGGPARAGLTAASNAVAQAAKN